MSTRPGLVCLTAGDADNRRLRGRLERTLERPAITSRASAPAERDNFEHIGRTGTIVVSDAAAAMPIHRPLLVFTAAEWQAFLAGAHEDQFELPG
jgi:hypothetical protein